MTRGLAMLVLATLVARPVSGALDVVGYYGNSGNAVSYIPLIKDIHPAYNVVVLTFATWVTGPGLYLDIQGPYKNEAHNNSRLAADVAAWKAVPDKWGRRKLALVSVGGANVAVGTTWPAKFTAAKIDQLDRFLEDLNADGLDIDFEYGSVSEGLDSLAPVIRNWTARGKIVTAAPLAYGGGLFYKCCLDFYRKTLPLFSWVQPQFYNCGPGDVTGPFKPDWSGAVPADWQAESGGQAYWAAALDGIARAAGLTKAQLGMLMPMTQFVWDIPKLARQVKASGTRHIGTWAIAYDHQQGWKLAKALAGLLDEPASVSGTFPEPEVFLI